MTDRTKAPKDRTVAAKADPCMCIWQDACSGTGHEHCGGCGGDLCICVCGGERDCPGCAACRGLDTDDVGDYDERDPMLESFEDFHE